MSGKFLLDTNIVIALFARDPAVLGYIAEAEEIFVPAIVLGELHYGARKSARAQENAAKIEEFAGAVKDALRAKGRPIPENDIWIAAVAVQHGLAVASRDPHFREVGGLALAAW